MAEARPIICVLQNIESNMAHLDRAEISCLKSPRLNKRATECRAWIELG